MLTGGGARAAGESAWDAGEGFSARDDARAGDLLKLGSDIMNGERRKCESRGDCCKLVYDLVKLQIIRE